MVIWFETTMLRYVHGPCSQMYISQCNKVWWSLLLYINNFFEGFVSLPPSLPLLMLTVDGKSLRRPIMVLDGGHAAIRRLPAVCVRLVPKPPLRDFDVLLRSVDRGYIHIRGLRPQRFTGHQSWVREDEG